MGQVDIDFRIAMQLERRAAELLAAQGPGGGRLRHMFTRDERYGLSGSFARQRARQASAGE